MLQASNTIDDEGASKQLILQYNQNPEKRESKKEADGLNYFHAALAMLSTMIGGGIS